MRKRQWLRCLRDNIHGLELDERCTQIAAFNVALTAWKLAGYQALPGLNLACSGFAPSTSKEEWMALAGDNERVRNGMARLHSLFKDAPILGSLINPLAQDGNLIEAEFHELAPLLTAALSPNDNQQSKIENDAVELAVIAQGLAKAAELLAGQFTLIATNVPFKETKQLILPLREHIESNFHEGRGNLATAFLVRITKFLSTCGTAAVVSPHEWLFLKSYAPIRKKLLDATQWVFLADLGERAFESSQAAGAFTALISFSNGFPPDNHNYYGWDATKQKHPVEKAQHLLDDKPVCVPQADQLKNPDARIGLRSTSSLPLLSKYAGSYVGLQNGDTPHFVGYFWELPYVNKIWEFFELPCDQLTSFGGREGIVRWENGNGELAN